MYHWEPATEATHVSWSYSAGFPSGSAAKPRTASISRTKGQGQGWLNHEQSLVKRELLSYPFWKTFKKPSKTSFWASKCYTSTKIEIHSSFWPSVHTFVLWKLSFFKTLSKVDTFAEMEAFKNDDACLVMWRIVLIDIYVYTSMCLVHY